MWIPTVVLSLAVLTATSAAIKYSPPPSHKAPSGSNQRILHVQGPGQLTNHFTSHHHHPHHHSHHHLHSTGSVAHVKTVRTRPSGQVPGKGYVKAEEYIRPNQPPPIPPFFNGPSTNKVKHLPRPPPPHVHHKLVTYGGGFPYKSSSSLRTTLSKPPFKKPSSLASLGSLASVGSVASVGSIGFRPTTVKVPAASPAQVTHVTPVPKVQTKLTATSASYYSPTFASFSYGSGHVRHVVSSDDNNGPIREVPAPNLGPGPGPAPGKGSGVGLTADSLAHVQTDGFNAGVGVGGLDVTNFVKDAVTDASFGKEHTLELSNFDQDASLDVTNLLKHAVESEKYSTGYQVTEHHNLPTNDQVLKSHDGTKLYYAPDPDPSLPVFKVPPTKDPHSMPSYGAAFNSLYLSQLPQGYPYLQAGASVGGPVATLSSNELYQLMHGYPAVLSQPLVAFVSQPQASGMLLHPGTSQAANVLLHGSTQTGNTLLHGSGQQYYPQNSGNAGDENDILQYLQNPEIHNLLHNTPDSHQGQESSSHSSVATSYTQQSLYSPQHQNYAQSQYQPYYYPDSHSQASSVDDQYEPEASESRNSVTVIRQTQEGTVGASLKDVSLDDDADDDDDDARDKAANSLSEDVAVTTEAEAQVYQLKNLPEVPFYSSLPSEQAAKTLASLQAAGSVANKYLNRLKVSRVGDDGSKTPGDVDLTSFSGSALLKNLVKKENDQNEEDDDDQTSDNFNGDDTTGQTDTSSIADVRVDDDDSDDRDFSTERQTSAKVTKFEFKQDPSNETFGKRLRPK